MTYFLRCITMLFLSWILCACTLHKPMNTQSVSQKHAPVASVKKDTLSKRTQVAQCMNVCKQRLSTCEKVCRNNCKPCKAYVTAQALKGYTHYAHEKAVEGTIIARELNSYKDPLQCSKTTCSCKADYQVCVQSCGGVIHKIWSAPPICG